MLKVAIKGAGYVAWRTNKQDVVNWAQRTPAEPTQTYAEYYRAVIKNNVSFWSIFRQLFCSEIVNSIDATMSDIIIFI